MRVVPGNRTLTTHDFLKNADDEDEFGLMEPDGMVHGYVVRWQRDDDGEYMFSVISALCPYGNFLGTREDRLAMSHEEVNCLLCLARVLEPGR